MRIVEGWVTATRGLTLSAAAVATDFFEERPPRLLHFLPHITRQSLCSLRGDSNRGRCGVNVGMARHARAALRSTIAAQWPSNVMRPAASTSKRLDASLKNIRQAPNLPLIAAVRTSGCSNG